MKILSIETSCDETGISILEAKKKGGNVSFKILANILNSQVKIHAQYGGVFPALAKREHQKNLPILLEKAFKKSKLKIKEIDLITVTSGPGLEPALWTGIVFAKELAEREKIPLVPVNHMEGHIFSVFAQKGNTFNIPLIKFPSLALLVSGGHTELVLIKNFRNYEIIGETLDDAAGEAFDKVARMLKLPYPGGPEISRLAEKARRRVLSLQRLESATARARGIFQQKNIRALQGQNLSQASPESFLQVLGSPTAQPDHSENLSGYAFSLPRPMLHSKNFDFSFSGLKTAVLYLIRDLQKIDSDILQNDKIKMQIAKEFEDAIIETLVFKTKKALEKYKIKTLIVAGGVSANKYLKKEIQKITKQKDLYFPNKNLSGDNALMIGIAGYFKFKGNREKTIKPNKIKAEGGLRL
jgi:N6-L-threonylcarbamoyladenine synthase